jgi:hypothetical protein
MEINNIQTILEKFTAKNNIFKFIIYWLFLPIKLLLEYICWYKIWKKTILVELIENDKIFEFLNKNEFAYKFGRLQKYDVIPEDNEFYSMIKNLTDLKSVIKQEYVDNIVELVERFSNFDIQNYITVFVEVKMLSIKDNEGNTIFKRIYGVAIQYWRYYWLILDLKNLIVWLLLLISIILGINIYL